MNPTEVGIPLVPEVGVISLVPDEWHAYWQPRHQVLMRLSRYYHVVWVNPAQEFWPNLKRRRETYELSVEQHSGLTIYEPEPWLPVVHRPLFLRDFTFQQRLKHASDLLARGVCKRVLSIWRPDFANALKLADFDVSCYHIDDEYSFSAVQSPIQARESRLLANVTQVFVHSPTLMQRKGWLNPNTEMVPNGVDFQTYSQLKAVPSDLASIPSPRIGYTGWLKKHLDWSLLLRLTESHPDWSFVLVGPVSPHSEVREPIERLKSRSNVYLLGAKSAEALASYTQHFDVCIMPYAINDYTNCIYPLKLHEYLAAGRPTIGARIRSLEDFAQVVTLAVTPDEWSEAIRQALLPEANSSKKVRARQAVARQYDWEILTERIARTMALRLGPEYAERLDSATRSNAVPSNEIKPLLP
jgi:glycosyltransferase involved in cell wall biosynthesis